MRSATLFVLGIILYLQAYSQMLGNESVYVDSLQQVLSQAKNDSTKARIHYLLSDYWSYTDSSKSKYYLEEGKRYSRKNIFLSGIYAFYKAGYLYDIDIEASKKWYVQAATIFNTFTSNEAYSFEAKSWRNYATLLQRQDNEEEMVSIILTKAIPLVRKAKNKTLEGKYYGDVGLVFMNKLMHSKAAEYFEKGLKTLKQAPHEMADMFVMLNNTARNYCFMDSTSKAKPFIDEMDILVNPYPNAEYNVDYAITKSIYYRKINEPNKAIQCLLQGISLAKRLKKPRLENSLQFQLYKVYAGMGKYKQALIPLQYVMNNPVYSFMEDEVLHSYEMSETYAHLHDIPKAYQWLKKYTLLRDTMYLENLKNEMAAMEIKYDAVEKAKRIAVLETENQKVVLQGKNSKLTNALLTVVCFIILAILGFLIYAFRINKKIAQQKERNYLQQLKEMEQQRQLVTTEAMLEGEERERRRVARDLHDGLGGMLAGIKLKLSGHVAQKTVYQKDQEALNRIIDQLDTSVSELRRIARNMMPESLIRFGLQTALKDLCDSLTSNDINIQFQALEINESIELSIQVIIYRIIQEALTNSIRHSKAKHIMVQCSQNENMFYITVEDDGIGFNISAENTKGMGLSNIENRVQYLKGKMEVSSIPNEGTTINMELNVAA